MDLGYGHSDRARGNSNSRQDPCILKRDSLLRLISYYENNRIRMKYKKHRDAGRKIGSGMIESVHKHVIQARMKRAGQHWSEKDVEKMSRLRTRYKTLGPSRFAEELYKRAT